jgi:two-component system cell cycle sensor histidine kinase/response regulator CckA
VVFDENGQSLCANSEITRLTGGDVTDKSLRRLFEQQPQSLKAYEALWGRVERGENSDVDLEGGNGQWFNVSAAQVPEWPGFVQWRLANITSRRQLEEDRKLERSKLVDFLDNAPGGFFSVDAEGRFLFVNRTFADWVGTPMEELLSGVLRLHDFLQEPPKEGQPYDLVAGGGEAQHGDVVFRSRAGKIFPAAIAQTVVGSGTDIRTRAVVRDLLAEHEWQDKLAQSQRRFQRFFEDAPIGIALVDANGNVLEANDMMAAMIGRPLEETVKLTLADLLAPADQVRISTVLAAGGTVPDHPIEVRLSGDNEHVAQLFVRVLQGQSPDDSTFTLHFIDFTERKNLEQQFAQSQKMQAVGQLAGGIAHDFNNLLTAMIGFCDLLLLRHKPGDSSFGDIMQIKQNANRAANLVRQLLAFSRQQTLQPRVLDVTDALTELLHLIRRLIGENIELKMVHGRDLGLVRVDQGQLEQVLINLCVNARDAMPRGGKLSIKTQNRDTRIPMRMSGEDMPPGKWVAISVSDTGTGIPPAILTRIFEPFFSTKEVGSGTGLGLSTVYGIVRQTGGFVNVESVIDEGSTFSIYLPRHEAEEKAQTTAETQQEKPTGDLTGAGQILLVEDEDAVRMFSARALRNKGYVVHEAESGEKALTMLIEAQTPVDLLITDVIMPNMDGPTLVNEVRRSQPDLKVIFISGYTEDKVRSQFAQNEEIHFLPTPFTLKQLATKVKEVMVPGGV